MTMQHKPETVDAADAARFTAMINQDIPTLSGILADELVYLHSTGASDSKESFLAGIESKKFQFKSAERISPTVRLFGDTAILHGKVKLAVEVAGTVHHVQSGFTTVWLYRDGRWQLVHWQSTPQPKE